MSQFQIDVQTDESAASFARLLSEAVNATLTQQQAPSPATVALLLTDDAQLQALNRQYRGFDKSTDVLSFEDGTVPYPGADVHLGDIAISLPQAERQAAQGGHAVSAELQLLAVHGALHLVGHDHAESAEKTAMWHAQAAILTDLGCEITGPAIDA